MTFLSTWDILDQYFVPVLSDQTSVKAPAGESGLGSVRSHPKGSCKDRASFAVDRMLPNLHRSYFRSKVRSDRKHQLHFRKGDGFRSHDSPCPKSSSLLVEPSYPVRSSERKIVRTCHPLGVGDDRKEIFGLRVSHIQEVVVELAAEAVLWLPWSPCLTATKSLSLGSSMGRISSAGVAVVLTCTI